VVLPKLFLLQVSRVTGVTENQDEWDRWLASLAETVVDQLVIPTAAQSVTCNFLYLASISASILWTLLLHVAMPCSVLQQAPVPAAAGGAARQQLDWASLHRVGPCRP